MSGPVLASVLSAGTQRVELPSGGQQLADVAVKINGTTTSAFTIAGGQTVILDTPLAAAGLVEVSYADHRTASSAATTLASKSDPSPSI